jgi:RNA polymerase sigma-70 factor (ECF subfamily)
MEESPNEQDLILRLARGDERAFLALYDRFAPRVHGLALRILGDKMAAEDVTQETFLKIWARARTFSPGRGSAAGWLLTVARRAALDRLRLDGRQPQLADTGEDALARISDPQSQSQESRWRSLRFALAEIPAEQRQVIALAYYFGLSQSQIAEHLGIPLGTVKTRMRLGMAKLRQAVLEDG